IEDGAVRPVLDRTYPLERIAQAHLYVETGHKSGGVALEMSP
ncbi:MAG: zinc-binding dehydrogenase, partial [Candidatus Eremiobacteraeota bacterium]|nr:zinc-binding dehydrogenase [Candidatus Eremiobacteraeota bacterium]